MAIRGTKKSIEALEQLFETGNKPTQQDFFDFLSSFLHRDEDISFLVSLAKATVTDVQAGVENSRFMTSLRTYQSILWWVRLSKLPLLNGDIVELVDGRINALFATDDNNNIIDTLGEVIQAFQSYDEQVGGIDNLRDRIVTMEEMLHQVPKNLRQIQNTFDSLGGAVATAQATANGAVSAAATADSKAVTADGKAGAAQATANGAQATANGAVTAASTADAKAVTADGKAGAAQASANAAQATANGAVTSAGIAKNTADSALNGVFANAAVIGGHEARIALLEAR